MEMRSFQEEKYLSMPCEAFGYFLKFLCYHHLKDNISKRHAFNELTVVVKYLIKHSESYLENADICLAIASNLMNE